MDPLEQIDAVLAAIRKSTIREAGALNPALLEDVANDQAEIESHEARLEAQRRPTPPQPPRPKTELELEAEKDEREAQERTARAVADLEAERAAAGEE